MPQDDDIFVGEAGINDKSVGVAVSPSHFGVPRHGVRLAADDWIV
jgi:hypothetical protein